MGKSSQADFQAYIHVYTDTQIYTFLSTVVYLYLSMATQVLPLQPSPPSVSGRRPDRRRQLQSYANVLAELQNFFDGHSFNTEGPYSDLFAVLLSTSKHLLDVSADLVDNIESLEVELDRRSVEWEAMAQQMQRLSNTSRGASTLPDGQSSRIGDLPQQLKAAVADHATAPNCSPNIVTPNCPSCSTQPLHSASVSRGSAESEASTIYNYVESRLSTMADEWKAALDDVCRCMKGGATPLHPPRESPSTASRRNPSQSSTPVPTQAAAEPNMQRLLETHLQVYHQQSQQQLSDIEKQLHDALSRLEVLEVYAPHQYAVATRPPLLGLELEDVVTPREGVRVVSVYHGYLADHAGISVGDVIIGSASTAISSRAQLYVSLTDATRCYQAQCQVEMEKAFLDQFLHDGTGPGTSTSGYQKKPYAYRHKERMTPLAVSSAPSFVPRSSQVGSASHISQLANCFPHMELKLDILRDGRAREVVILISPSVALRQPVP